jgi:site-specific DNA-cytosine methylase
MNRKDLASHGESGDTFRAIYNYADQHRPRIILLENVKAKTNVWVDLVSQWDKIGYEARWVILDTKDYYLPQTRQRMYMIAVERKLYGKDACKAADQWGSIMQKLQRRCSSPYEAFISEVRQESDTHSTIQFDPDWVLSKLRYDHIRAKCLLGMLRTLTKWNETGTIL